MLGSNSLERFLRFRRKALSLSLTQGIPRGEKQGSAHRPIPVVRGSLRWSFPDLLMVLSSSPKIPYFAGYFYILSTFKVEFE